MKISILQMDVLFQENKKNYQKIEKLISDTSIKGSDVLVLPETWNAGFFPKENLEKFADWEGEETKRFFQKLCQNYSIHAVAGSIVNQKEGKICNTSYIFNRKGEEIASYDKVHLFSPMKEHEFFESGNRFTTFSIDGVLCGIIICYDLRFLEWIRTLALEGIQVLFVVAQWPEARIEHWKLLNQVRAIENQFYVVAVNACGTIGNLKFGGNSLVIDPWGKILYQFGAEEEIYTIEIQLEDIKKIRESINIFRDRKPELYKI